VDVLDLPRVAGQHRNRPLAAERRRRAVEMSLIGHTYQAIADELGYANRGTVHRIVKAALADHEMDSVDELRQLELDRLDTLQYAYWAQALAGDHAAANIVLKVMDRRLKLLTLPVAWDPSRVEAKPEIVRTSAGPCRSAGRGRR
jgi:transposase-like protein